MSDASPFTHRHDLELYRGHAQDYDDMVSLWALCEFDTPAAAVEAFWSGYPHAPEDPHLVELVSRIASEAAGRAN